MKKYGLLEPLGNDYNWREKLNAYGARVLGLIAPTLAVRCGLFCWASYTDSPMMELIAWAAAFGINFAPTKDHNVLTSSVEYFTDFGTYYANSLWLRRRAWSPPNFEWPSALESIADSADSTSVKQQQIHL